MTQTQAMDILKTGANVFLTGEPGSGKTHTINEYVRYLKKAQVGVAVTASTGIAATHIGGGTIHAWSGIGIKRKLSEYDLDRIATSEPVVKRIKRAAVLVIDEVSMLEGEVLNSVERVCREIRHDTAPFGGLQVVVVGDFFQLPPVWKETGRRPQFAFESDAWQRANFLICYLSEQHRQVDQVFGGILAAMRQNGVQEEHRERLAGRQVDPSVDLKNVTKLFTHNLDVDRMNTEELTKIPGDSKTFCMSTQGSKKLVEQLRRGCMSPERLTLKEGAVVMFTKNNPKGQFVNGTLGKVVGFNRYSNLPVVLTKSGQEITAEPMTWQFDDEGRIKAQISQVPLRLAWAITVHKSQGMSLDASLIDLRTAFVAGQGYVALSRVRTLAGLFLVGFNEQALAVDQNVLEMDEVFREQSNQASEVFTAMPVRELCTIQDNFLRAVGGVKPAVALVDRRLKAIRRRAKVKDLAL